MARLARLVVLCVALVLVALAYTAQAAPGAPGAPAESDSSSNPPVLGAKRCTWGPSYWCNSHANANECEALEWCYEKKMLTRQ